MKNKEDEDKIMRNHLKDTEEECVKDDYSSNEREQIWLLTKQAKTLFADNLEKIFKIQGNWKNFWWVYHFSSPIC